MGIDLLEQLAELPVPPAPPPAVFDRGVHERINSRLVVGQVSDLLIRGSAFGFVHFAKARRWAVTAYPDGKVRNSEKWAESVIRL